MTETERAALISALLAKKKAKEQELEAIARLLREMVYNTGTKKSAL